MTLIHDGYPFRPDDRSAHGLTSYRLRRSLETGDIRQVVNGACVDARVADSRWLRLRTAQLLVPEYAVVCDDFAAWLHGVDTAPPGRRHELRPSLLIPHGRNRITPQRARCRQVVSMPADVVEMDGVRVTSPLLTTVDLLRRSFRPYALAAGDSMVREGAVAKPLVCAAVAELRRLPGTKQAQELAPRIDRRAATPGESWQRCRVLDAGFPTPELQWQVVDELGGPRFFDMAYPEVLAASEYDGREFHTTDADRRHDSARRGYFERRFGWRFSIGLRETIFGDDPTFERVLGAMIGVTPRPRTW